MKFVTIKNGKIALGVGAARLATLGVADYRHYKKEKKKKKKKINKITPKMNLR